MCHEEVMERHAKKAAEEAAEAAARDQRIGIAQARRDKERQTKADTAVLAKQEQEQARAESEAQAARAFKGYIRGHKGKRSIDQLYETVAADQKKDPGSWDFKADLRSIKEARAVALEEENLERLEHQAAERTAGEGGMGRGRFKRRPRPPYSSPSRQGSSEEATLRELNQRLTSAVGDNAKSNGEKSKAGWRMKGASETDRLLHTRGKFGWKHSDEAWQRKQLLKQHIEENA